MKSKDKSIYKGITRVSWNDTDHANAARNVNV